MCLRRPDNAKFWQRRNSHRTWHWAFLDVEQVWSDQSARWREIFHGNVPSSKGAVHGASRASASNYHAMHARRVQWQDIGRSVSESRASYTCEMVKTVNGFRYYRALESVSIASALSTARPIYPCQIRVHQRWQSKLQLPTARKKEWRPATAGCSHHAVTCQHCDTHYFSRPRTRNLPIVGWLLVQRATSSATDSLKVINGCLPTPFRFSKCNSCYDQECNCRPKYSVYRILMSIVHRSSK